jgi:hypothetical protein
MSDPIHLRLPLIAAAQSQRHVTHNEAIRDFDLLVMVWVLELFRMSPPAKPQNTTATSLARTPLMPGRAITSSWPPGSTAPWAMFQPNRG